MLVQRHVALFEVVGLRSRVKYFNDWVDEQGLTSPFSSW